MCDPVRTLKSQSKKLVQITFRLINTLGIFSVILYKGDKFCDFLFAFLRIMSFLKSGQVLKERTRFHTFFFKLRREAKIILVELPPVKVYQSSFKY